MRLHPANLLQPRLPLDQRRIGYELREHFIGDRLDFRNEKRRRFSNLCQQILNLPNARQVFGVRAVFRELKRDEVIEPLNFQIERFFKLKTLRQILGRFPKLPFPLRKPRISPLNPGEIFLPLRNVGKKMCEIPFVGVRDFKTSWNRDRRHPETSNVNAQRPTSNPESSMNGLRCSMGV